MIFRLLLEWNTIVLHQFSGNIGVGIYQAAFRFMLATMVISDVLLQAFFPLIARLATTDRPASSRPAPPSTAISSPAARLPGRRVFRFRGGIGPLVFGAAYAGSVPALKILALAVLVNFLSAAPSVALIALGRQGTRARASIAVLAFNAAAAFILIPGHGAVGAALAMLAAFILHAVAEYRLRSPRAGQFLFRPPRPGSGPAGPGGGPGRRAAEGAAPALGLAAYAVLGEPPFSWPPPAARKKRRCSGPCAFRAALPPRSSRDPPTACRNAHG